MAYYNFAQINSEQLNNPLRSLACHIGLPIALITSSSPPGAWHRYTPWFHWEHSNCRWNCWTLVQCQACAFSAKKRRPDGLMPPSPGSWNGWSSLPDFFQATFVIRSWCHALFIFSPPGWINMRHKSSHLLGGSWMNTRRPARAVHRWEASDGTSKIRMMQL